jgi:hypothetical protein
MMILISIYFKFSITTKVISEELYPLGCNAVYSDKSQPTISRNISPPPSGQNSKPSKKPIFLLHAGFLLGLLFNPENGGDIFLRNVS